MPDISMCANQTCPDRELCYRFTATPNEYRQSYAGFAPRDGARQCEHYTPNDAAFCAHDGTCACAKFHDNPTNCHRKARRSTPTKKEKP